MSDNNELQVIDGATGEMVGPMDVAPDFAISIEESQRRVQQLQKFIHSQMKIGEDYGTIPGCGTKKALLKPGAEKLNSLYGFAPLVEVTQRVEDWDNGNANYEVKVTLMNKRTGQVEAEGIGSCNSRESKYAKQPVANVANTLLKMAKKRALVDATLSATRVSGLFDAEEAVESGDHNEAALVVARYEGLRFAANLMGAGRPDGQPWPAMPPIYDASRAAQVVRRIEVTLTEFVQAFGSLKEEAPPEARNDAVEPEPQLATPIGDAALRNTQDRAALRQQLDASPLHKPAPVPPPEPKEPRPRTELQRATDTWRARCKAMGLDLAQTDEARAVRYGVMAAFLGKAPAQSMKAFTIEEIEKATAAIEAGTLKWEGEVAAA